MPHGLTLIPSHQSLTSYSRRLMTFEYRPTCPADYPVEGIQKLVSRKKTRSAWKFHSAWMKYTEKGDPGRRFLLCLRWIRDHCLCHECDPFRRHRWWTCEDLITGDRCLVNGHCIEGVRKHLPYPYRSPPHFPRKWDIPLSCSSEFQQDRGFFMGWWLQPIRNWEPRAMY